MDINSIKDIRRSYNQPALSLESMKADPMEEFKLWFELAYEVYESDCNAMVLSTVNRHGQPSSRTVLLKEITTEGFVFYSNYLSKKGEDMLANPQVSLLFYWAALDRQIRIEGKVKKVPAIQSDQYFQSRPRGSQISAIISPQSQEITSYEDLEQRWKEIADQTDLQRPKHWGGLIVKPHYFEFWQGRANRLHDRIVYLPSEKKRSFVKKRLAP